VPGHYGLPGLVNIVNSSCTSQNTGTASVRPTVLPSSATIIYPSTSVPHPSSLRGYRPSIQGEPASCLDSDHASNHSGPASLAIMTTLHDPLRLFQPVQQPNQPMIFNTVAPQLHHPLRSQFYQLLRPQVQRLLTAPQLPQPLGTLRLLCLATVATWQAGRRPCTREWSMRHTRSPEQRCRASPTLNTCRGIFPRPSQVPVPPID